MGPRPTARATDIAENPMWAQPSAHAAGCATDVERSEGSRHPRARPVVHHGGMTGPSPAWIAEVEALLGVPLPESVRALYRVSDGWYSPGGQWFVVWPLARLLKANQDAWDHGLPRNLLAFGDDGTGDPFCVDLAESTHSVVRWNWMCLEVERQEGSMEAFRAEWLR